MTNLHTVTRVPNEVNNPNMFACKCIYTTIGGQQVIMFEASGRLCPPKELNIMTCWRDPKQSLDITTVVRSTWGIQGTVQTEESTPCLKFGLETE